MKRFFQIFLLILMSSTFFMACSEDEDTTMTEMEELSANEEAYNKALGDWVSIRVEEDGEDITANSSGTFSFAVDSTFQSVATENGASFTLEGSFEFMEDGTMLELDYPNSGGLAKYDVLKLTEEEMSLSITVFGKTRISDFEKE